MQRITVVGSINVDLSMRVQRHPKPGETVIGTESKTSPGGKGANQAVAAALQGAQVSFIGAIGNDAYAARATSLMVDAGVGLAGVEKLGEPTGMAVITVADDGENSIVVLPGANGEVTGAFVQQHGDIVQAADIVLLQGEIPASGFEAAVALAGGRVVVNLAPVITVSERALLAADPLIVNEHEAGWVLRQFGHIVEPAVDADAEHTVRELLAAGFSSVVLTLGAAGALVGLPDGNVASVPTPKVTAVDTTGAGDAFTGALVARLAAGDALVDAARYAARVGAYAVTGYGAQTSYPNKNSVLPEV